MSSIQKQQSLSDLLAKIARQLNNNLPASQHKIRCLNSLHDALMCARLASKV